MTSKTAVITGATGAIGAALCRAFKNDGFTVIGTDKREESAVSCDRFVPADLALFVEDDAYRHRMMRDIAEAIGGVTLDALVNNAAVQVVGPVESLSAENWRQTLNVNLIAPFLLIQGLLPFLKAAKGAVVNIGSVHSKLTKPRFSCYATSKAGLSGLTRSLAVELGGAVRVNEVVPAATATPMLAAGFEGRGDALEKLKGMHPIGRIADPDEIAQVAVFLASEKASFVTGAALDVAGGIGARLHDPE